ncbi:MAG: BrnT family toxin [Campylobacterota bacterium]|nr:BrnT family toxin [Campylobacterota bacterium]
MITYNWNTEKNLLLKKERGISFEQIVSHIESGDLLDIIAHPNKENYLHQQILIVQIEDYVIAVPFVEDGKERFLKTIIPSRKLTKQYLKDSK